jgi:putative transposase
MRSRNRNHFETINNLYFVTSTIVGFVRVFNDDLYNTFINTLRFYQMRGDYRLLCYTLMPNHFHLILKTGDTSTVSQCVGNIKRIMSKQITSYLILKHEADLLRLLNQRATEEPSSDCRIWKPRFDCMVIIKEDILKQKIEYCHWNPVRAGLVKEPVDWLYSSARNYAGQDMILLDVDNEWNCLN